MVRQFKSFIAVVLLTMLIAACGANQPELRAPTPTVRKSTSTPTPIPSATPTVTPIPAVTTPTPIIPPTPTADPFIQRDTPPTARIFSNGDEIRDMLFFDGKMWVATLGGVLAWDTEAGTYTKYTTLDGLPHIGVTALTVCPIPEPTLIAGTTGGLTVYDPVQDRWTGIDALREPMSDFDASVFGDGPQGIRQLACDTVNERFLFASDGLDTLDLNSGALRHYDLDAGLPTTVFEDMAVVDGDIWLTTLENGVIVITDDGVVLLNQENGFPADETVRLAVAADNTVWIGATNGLVRWQDGEVELFNGDNTTEFNSYGPTVVYAAADGQIWVEIGTTICVLNTDLRYCDAFYKRQPGMSDGPPQDIVEDDAGNIYYYTRDNGFSRFNGVEWTQFTQTEEPPVSNLVSAITQDAAGDIWLGGLDLVRLNRDATEWELLPDGFARGNNALIRGMDGDIWALGDRAFYHIVDGEAMRWNKDQGLRDVNHFAMAQDEFGRIWVGGENGVSIWDGTEFSYLDETNGFPETRVNALLWNDGAMWAGTNAGLMRLSDEGAEIVLSTDDLGGNVRALTAANDGSMLLAGAFGVASFDGTEATPVGDLTASIITIDMGPSGLLWAGSVNERRGGLYRWDGTEWTWITAAGGLPTNSVRAVFEDDAGNVWVGAGDSEMGGGVYRLGW